VLRLPTGGGAAQVYRVPSLEPTKWATEGTLAPLRRSVGADLDQGLVYLLSVKGEIVALDLQTGRIRPQVVTRVRDAAMGPDGSLFTVDDSNAVTQVVRRNPVKFQSRLASRPRDLFGTQDGDLLAITTGPSTTLNVLSSDQPSREVALPNGDATATFWGDLIAVAADTAVVLVDLRDKGTPDAVPVADHARAVVFSPSGHRFYVAQREGGVLVFNRFTDERIAEIDLPGPARALRMDPYGRWLMVHPPSADSLWLVDLASNQRRGGVATAWAPDLPSITNQQTLLYREGPDVVARDLSRRDRPIVGRVAGGAKDYWLPLAWTPETGTASPQSDTTAVAVEDSAGARAEVFLQVSSSQNKTWAGELASQLSSAGLPAKVVEPNKGEEGYRVVLGPYPSRETAESAGRKLGRPFFIYQPDR
jgi:hypothetical protein